MSSTSPQPAPLNTAPFQLGGRPAVLLAPGEFSTFGAKTAVCYLRYRASDVVAVVDPAQGGRTVESVLGFGGDVPVVRDLEAAFAFGPRLAVVGVAPCGGRLTPDLRSLVLDCVRAGLDVASGLHDFLEDDEELVGAARASGASLWDARWVPETGVVGAGKGCTTGARTVLVVGSDCNVGKMTATVEIYHEAVRRSIRAAWAATGQTGIMLRGRGVAVDRVVADFIGGAVEAVLNAEGADRDLVIVEGQGSIVHPGFAAVTLGLLYGAMPDCLVIVHAAERRCIGESGVPIPPLADLIHRYESALAPFKRAPVVAVSLNTSGLEEREACDMIDRTAAEVGIPVVDPVRFGPAPLVDAIVAQLF